MLLAVVRFGQWVHNSLSYGLMAALLGLGYGLNYSRINERPRTKRRQG